MLQRARTLIFSTAPPPAMADALDAALDLIGEEPERRERLLDLSVKLRELLIAHGIEVTAGLSQIVPVIIGESETAVDVAELLQVQGFDVRAIRPPSVAPGSCRLRLSVNVNLDEEILEEFSHTLAETLHRHIGVAA
jgi:8-amino-7-oxononanoate synthase